MDALPIKTAILSFVFLIFVMFDSTFLLAHICYYIIAHYTELLLPYSSFGVVDKDQIPTSSRGYEELFSPLFWSFYLKRYNSDEQIQDGEYVESKYPDI
jgi:hypothetical protein